MSFVALRLRGVEADKQRRADGTLQVAFTKQEQSGTSSALKANLTSLE
jgi:hypothetical protein